MREPHTQKAEVHVHKYGKIYYSWFSYCCLVVYSISTFLNRLGLSVSADL